MTDKFSMNICGQEWESGLLGFSEKEIYKALEFLKAPSPDNEYENHPPTLPQFVGICQMIRKRSNPVNKRSWQRVEETREEKKSSHDQYRRTFADYGYPAECIAHCEFCAENLAKGMMI